MKFPRNETAHTVERYVVQALFIQFLFRNKVNDKTLKITTSTVGALSLGKVHIETFVHELSLECKNKICLSDKEMNHLLEEHRTIDEIITLLWEKTKTSRT